MTRDEQPRMFGISIFCAVIGGILSALCINDEIVGQSADAGSWMLAIALLIGAYASYRLDAKLSRMTPEQRDAYWAAFEKRHPPIDRTPPDIG